MTNRHKPLSRLRCRYPPPGISALLLAFAYFYPPFFISINYFQSFFKGGEAPFYMTRLGLLAARPAQRSSRLDEFRCAHSCQNPLRCVKCTINNIYCSFSLFCCEEKRENEPKEKNTQSNSALPAASL